MFYDLATITLIGCVLEALVTMMSGYVFISAPSITFGLLLITMAVVRWHFWGLTTIPFIALANCIGGHFNRFSYFAAMYDWRMGLSIGVGLLVFIIDIIIFKKLGTKKTLNNLWLFISMLVINYILFNLVQVGFYNLITSGNPLKVGEILYSYNIQTTNDLGETIISTKKDNLCVYAQNSFTYNLIGLRIMIVGGVILKYQGVLTNAYEKLVDDKKKEELDRIDAETFSISETDEEEEHNTADSNELKL